jgi:hypothetical protein
MPLHLTKIAFGAQNFADIADWFEARCGRPIDTRYRPARWQECAGGSVYWISQHHIVGRTPIAGFEESGSGRCLIELEPLLVPVAALPKRAHQGWRYLKAEPPRDLEPGEEAGDLLPRRLAGQLQRLALL